MNEAALEGVHGGFDWSELSLSENVEDRRWGPILGTVARGWHTASEWLSPTTELDSLAAEVRNRGTLVSAAPCAVQPDPTPGSLSDQAGYNDIPGEHEPVMCEVREHFAMGEE